MPPSLVASAEQITPQWLTQVLQAAGVDARVDSFTMQSVGTGQVGENVRFTLAGENVPATVVGKFASDDPVSRQTGIALQNYVREVFYYQHLDASVDIQTPTILFTAIHEATHDFVIMMEDLAPGVQGDQLGGCSVDDAALAMEQLARLQGPRWGDVSLQDYPLLSNDKVDPDAPTRQTLYSAVEEAFHGRYDGRMAPEHSALVPKVGARLGEFEEIYTGPPVLSHVDYRLDNMMFGGPRPLTVVDWQSINLGSPLLDASYFLGTSLVPEVRGKEEVYLLRHYLDVLKSYKVTMDWNECFRYYRYYAPAGLVMAVIASMIVGETERGNDMFMIMAERSSQMCLDLDWQRL